jgi:uncharacterized membrane protein
MHVALAIFFRWLHIVSACVAIGAVFFMRILVPRGLATLDPVPRKAAFLQLRRGLKMVIHSAILFLIVSGIYNSWLNWDAYNQIGPVAQPLWGTHVLLALIIFTIALYVLAGVEPPGGHAKWMAVNLVLMAALLAVAATLKYAREHHGISESGIEIQLQPTH